VIVHALLAGILILPAALISQETDETRLNLDLKDVKAETLLKLLAEVGGFNLVVGPDVECKLTLNIKAVPWHEVYETALRSCRLGEDRMGENLVRVAPIEELARELEDRHLYEEAKKAAGQLRTTTRRLTYARAKEIAPMLRKFLSPRGDVSFDERTNTLIITDVERNRGSA
jgi:type IV pilus assembly protein PilQ